MPAQAAPSRANVSMPADTQAQEPLQAVVIADAFEHIRLWEPLVRDAQDSGSFECDTLIECSPSLTLPWCLFPLLNQPLLAWTLEALASSGVEKATVYVGDGVEIVKTWLSHSVFSGPLSPIEVQICYARGSSQGDVLRDADALKLTSNFLLIQCGYLGNLDLSNIVTAFSQKQKQDDSLVMDCILGPKQPGSSHQAVYAVSETSQMLHFEMTPRFPRRKRTRLPAEALERARDFALRFDLASVGVDVCAPDVPALFTENFDYQNVHPHFVNGILTSDLLGKTISCTVIGETSIGAFSKRSPDWAMLVGTPRSYAAASDALLSRLVYPLAADENLAGSHDRYEGRPGGLYLGRKVMLARTCSLQLCAIGHKCTVSADTTLTNTVLGDSCFVESGCSISNSFIQDGTHIEHGCIIRASMIGRNVHIGHGSIVEMGSLIADGVTLGSRAHVAGARLSAEPKTAEGDLPDRVHLGEGATAHVWPPLCADFNPEAEDEADDARNLTRSALSERLGRLSFAEGDDAVTEDASSISALSRVASSSVQSEAGEHQQPTWAIEVADSFERAIHEGHGHEDAAVELKTMRMSFNVLIAEVRHVVMQVLARHAVTVDMVRNMVLKWKPLLLSLRDDDEPAQEGAEDILSLQSALAGVSDETEAIRLFARWLRELYTEDVVSPDAVLQWAGLPSVDVGKGAMRAMREAAQPLVDLCDESEEEESE